MLSYIGFFAALLNNWLALSDEYLPPFFPSNKYSYGFIQKVLCVLLSDQVQGRTRFKPLNLLSVISMV
jgi:hypothetical protein